MPGRPLLTSHRKPAGPAPSAAIRRDAGFPSSTSPRRPRLRFRRYFLAGLGVAGSALALALTVSVLAVLSGEPEPPVALFTSATSAGGSGGSSTLPSLSAVSGTQEAGLAPETQAWPAQSILLPGVETAASDTDKLLHAFGIRAGPPTQPGPAAADAAQPVLEQARAPPRRTPLGRISGVNITFYDCAHQGFCGKMANGRGVYEGAAACSYDLPLGTRFYIHGDPTARVYRCDDRGLLPNTWVDIFWYAPADGWDWQAVVGRYGTIDIVEWGRGDQDQ